MARAATLAFALLLVLVPAAFASEWTTHSLSGEGADSQLFGISCPGTTLCVGVGGNNTVATSTNPLAAGSWSTFYLGEGVAAGSPNQRQIKGVSCPSTGLCVAVSFLGLIFTSTDPAAGPGAWNTVDLDPSGPNTHFYGVSCPTTSFCVAVAGGGEIATSTNPTGGPGAWTMTKLPTPIELRGVSCALPSFCVAVGDSGTEIRPSPSNAGEVISSTAPGAGLWQETELPGAHGSLYGVSCPTSSFCLSGDMFGNVVGTTNPTGPASGWSSFSSGASVQITGASCYSPTECLLVDQNGDALTSADPLAGTGAWTVQNLIPYSADLTVPNALWSTSCPSPSFCAIGATGEALTSSNPSAPPPAPAPAPTPPKGGGKKPAPHLVRPKRPRAMLIPGQPSEVAVHGRKAILQFRFHVKRGFQARGYVCSFGGGKLHGCRSPRRYRVGPGHYRFRVRAVGWTGLRGRVAEEKVWVCRRTDKTTGRCLR